MIKNSCLATVFIFLIACANTERKNNLEKDTFQMKYYNEDGSLSSFGEMTKDSIKLGKWEYFVDGLKVVHEYMVIDGNEYLNQSWTINDKSDTINGVFLYEFEPVDTIKLGDIYSMKFYLEAPFFSKKTDLRLIYSKNFNSTFSNIGEVDKDTVLSVKEYNPDFTHETLRVNHMLEYRFIFSESGDKILRGFFEEIDRQEYNDSTIIRTRKTYLDKTIYVKDSL